MEIFVAATLINFELSQFPCSPIRVFPEAD